MALRRVTLLVNPAADNGRAGRLRGPAADGLGRAGKVRAIQARIGLPLGIVAAGTGNDSAAALGFPGDPRSAVGAIVAALRAGRTRQVDLGRTEPQCGSRWWLTVLCAGFDSAVNERANAMRWPRGPRRYDLAIALEAVRLGTAALTVLAPRERC